MQEIILAEIYKLSALLLQIQQDHELLIVIEKISQCCIEAMQRGKKILFAGNGGSAADSQHLAAELVVRLCYDRPGMPAIALTTDTSILTAVSNDHSFEHIFSRQIEALGQEQDVFIGISTSGKSPNIIKALQVAKERGLVTVCFTGKNIAQMQKYCDHVLSIPTSETSKIQECHIMFGHIICMLIETAIFPKQADKPMAIVNG